MSFSGTYSATYSKVGYQETKKTANNPFFDLNFKMIHIGDEISREDYILLLNELTQYHGKFWQKVPKFFMMQFASHLLDVCIGLHKDLLSPKDLERILLFPMPHDTNKGQVERTNIFYESFCEGQPLFYERSNIIDFLLSCGLSISSTIKLIVKTAECGKLTSHMLDLLTEKHNLLLIKKNISQTQDRIELLALKSLLSSKLPTEIKNAIQDQLKINKIPRFIDHSHEFTLFHRKKDDDFLEAQFLDDVTNKELILLDRILII